MLKSGSDRHSRRQSAGSRSSLVTVRPIEHSRSPSRPGEASTTSGPRIQFNSYQDDENGRGDVYKQKRNRSVSEKRTSGSTSKRSDRSSGHINDNAHSHNWSQSTSSTQSKEHKRRSSLSSKLGLPQSLSAIGMNRRTPSPTRKKRPADIAVPSANNGYAKAATLAPMDALAHGGTFYALESPMFPPDRPLDLPRTPLLHDFQIQGDDAPSTYTRSDQLDNSYHTMSRWSPPGLKPYESDRTNKPIASGFVRSAPSTSGGSSTNDEDRNIRRAVHVPEMEQRSYTTPFDFQQHARANVSSDRDRRTSPKRRKKTSRDSDKDRRKTMLASALQRATEAVELDKVLDVSAALTAYEEACTFLSEVADRSSSDVDKDKLRNIRDQYTVRIRELQQHDVEGPPIHDDSSQTDSGAELPDLGLVRPSFDGSINEISAPLLETARLTGIVDRVNNRRSGAYTREHRADSTSQHASSTLLAIPQSDIIPAPLSPRRPPPLPPSENAGVYEGSFESEMDRAPRESRIIDTNATHHLSWLDGAEDTLGTSPPSSHHSISSLNQLRRKHLRVHSTSTEAEFDAALDAAVEAAYDDGFEPTDDIDRRWSRPSLSHLSRQGSVLSNDPFALGKAQRRLAHSRSQSSRQRQTQVKSLEKLPTELRHEEECSDDEAEDILDRAHESSASASTSDARSKAGLPRQSDSSSSSGRTWASSAASSLNTAVTSLSTVDENSMPSRSRQLPGFSHPPPAPPPTTALPLPPVAAPGKLGFGQASAGRAGQPNLTLQDRRLSGRTGKSLKIETAATKSQVANVQDRNLLSPVQRPENVASLVPPKTAPGVLQSDVNRTVDIPKHDADLKPISASRQISSPFPTPFQATFSDFSESSTISPAETNLTSALSQDSSIRPSPFPASPIDPFFKHLNLRDNGSSLSLRSKGMLTPSSETDMRFPATPLSSSFSPINITETFASSNDPTPRARPRPLEPCPESQLLRPYWLLRCVYQTIAHPDGGFLTTKLCIPRKVWLMSNVKLKHVDDKVTYCELLTSSLLKLRAINTLDADAVLAEMEAFETVMSQVQTNLSKKLGNEVGTQGISTLFKEAPPSATVMSPTERARQDAADDALGKTNSTGSTGSKGKGYFSFRKLRGKQSDVNLAKTYTSIKEKTSSESLKMSTVPMTTSLAAPSARAAKSHGRPVSPLGTEIKAEGPNASYMAPWADSVMLRRCWIK